jgi:predicted Fe-Mo cluster-binding NifX family protein
MRIAITALNNSLESHIDSHFGRSAYFVIYDKEEKSIEFLPNRFLSMTEGAGAAAVKLLAERGVSQIISGEFGYKIKALVDSLRIQMIILKESDKTIQEIIDLLEKH